MQTVSTITIAHCKATTVVLNCGTRVQMSQLSPYCIIVNLVLTRYYIIG